jgi:CheY-like chemotaxis protein
MPHMTGFDLTREIKNIRSDIPIIMCTGFNDETDLAKANEIGIQEFIMKPLDKRLIAETIRKVLDK